MKNCKRTILVLVTALLVILASTNNVVAENNTCSSSYVKTNYTDKIKYQRNGNTVHFSGASGLYYITNLNSNPQYPDSDGNFSVDVPVGSPLHIEFYLIQSDGVCQVSDDPLTSTTLSAATSFRNPMYDNAVCVNYRNKWANNKTMRDAVPYCFAETTSVNYSYNEVREWTSTAESLYNDTINRQPTIVPDEKSVDNVNVGKLTCDYYQSGNTKTYSHVETVANGGGQNCKQTCKEVVTVIFGDPVATQAGMCFQYVVEVKSKVECEYTYTAPLPSKENVCVPEIVCDHGDGRINNYGGPTEDFDACIKSCDNGKYSQKCIESCYKEVYGKTGNNKVANTGLFVSKDTLLNSSFNTSATQVDNKGCLNPKGMNENDAAAIQALYEQHQKDPGGSFVIENGKTVWKKSTTGCPSDLAQTYFVTPEATKFTVHMVNPHYVGKNLLEYGADPNGSGFMFLLKMNNAAHDNAFCSQICKVENNTCAGGSLTTQAQAEEKYQKDLAAYRKAKDACENQAKICSTDTATYTITTENGKETVYKATQKQNSSSIGGPNPDIVIATTGICMGATTIEKQDGNDYRDVLTYAKAYINNKTGIAITNVKPGKEEFYTPAGNKFCTKLTSDPTNVDWYRWKVDKNGGALTADEKAIIDKNTKTNINAKIERFGFFGWSFDINCFYALIKNPNNYDPEDPIGTPEDPTGPKGGGGKTVTSDFIFRSVTLEDLFPESATAKQGRAPRFNWNCNGTDLNNKDYLIQPIALTKNIESAGESIYNESNSSQYLDYEFILTPETMTNIRKNYNAKYKNYSYPKSDDKNEVSTAGSQKTAGVTVYRSNFIHNFLNSNVVKKTGLIGCNNQLSETECDNRIYTENACYNEYASQSVR